MNCSQIRELLIGLTYNELTSGDAEMVREHLNHCSTCRTEYASLQELQNFLQSVPAPAVAVSVPAIFRRAAEIQAQRAKRWRRTAFSLSGLAAGILLVLIFRLEIHLSSGQVIVSWGGSSNTVDSQKNPKVESSTFIPPGPVIAAVSESEIQPLRGLIYALDSGLDQLSQDVDARDRRQQQQVARLQEQVTQLRVAFQRQLTTYLADSSKKGENR